MKVVRPLVEAELPSSNKPTAKITAVRPLASKVSPTKKAPPMTLDAQLVPMLYMAVCQDTLVTPSTSGLQRFRNAAAKQLGADGKIGLHGLNLAARRLGAGAASRTRDRPARQRDARRPGALALFPLLEHGTLRALDLSGCGLRGAFAPALAHPAALQGRRGRAAGGAAAGGGGAAPKVVAQPGKPAAAAASCAAQPAALRRLGGGAQGGRRGCGCSASGTTLGAAPPELVDASVLGLAALLSNARQLKSVDLSHNGFPAAAAAPPSTPLRAPRSQPRPGGNSLGDAGAELLAAVVSPDGGGAAALPAQPSPCGAGVRVGGGRALASAVRGGGGACSRRSRLRTTR